MSLLFSSNASFPLPDEQHMQQVQLHLCLLHENGVFLRYEICIITIPEPCMSDSPLLVAVLYLAEAFVNNPITLPSFCEKTHLLVQLPSQLHHIQLKIFADPSILLP